MLIANWNSLIDKFAPYCDWLSIREYEETLDSIQARNGKQDLSSSFISQTGTLISHGIMVEVLKSGQFGYSATVDLSHQGISTAFKSALALAETCAEHKLFTFDVDARATNKGTFVTDVIQPIDSLTFAEIQKKLIDTTNCLNIGNAIIDTWAEAKLITTCTHFISSNGSEWNQTFSVVGKNFGARAKSGKEIQSRSTGLQVLQTGLEGLDDTLMEEEAVRVANQAIELLHADECMDDTRDLILTPDQLCLQVHESVGHPLELDRILGDERNLAGWSFISPEDFGVFQYGSELMNITFDPVIPTQVANYAFDDAGTKARKEYLIRDGKLLRGIGGIESQIRSGLQGVACARAADWSRPPMDRMANINLEPGTSTLNAMIESTEKGILMETNRSWSIDDYRNKFQFGCEYARVIEDGELRQTVKNPNYRGITTHFWHNLKMAGNADTRQIHGLLYCGKGEPNQLIRVGHSTPTCLFTGIDIFGGA